MAITRKMAGRLRRIDPAVLTALCILHVPSRVPGYLLRDVRHRLLGIREKMLPVRKECVCKRFQFHELGLDLTYRFDFNLKISMRNPIPSFVELINPLSFTWD